MMFSCKQKVALYVDCRNILYKQKAVGISLPDGFGFLENDYAFADSFSYAAITAEISTLRASALMG